MTSLVRARRALDSLALLISWPLNTACLMTRMVARRRFIRARIDRRVWRRLTRWYWNIVVIVMSLYFRCQLLRFFIKLLKGLLRFLFCRNAIVKRISCGRLPKRPFVKLNIVALSLLIIRLLVRLAVLLVRLPWLNTRVVIRIRVRIRTVL